MSERLAQALREHGGLLAEVSRTPAGRGSPEPGPPEIAATGPRAAGHEDDYEVLLELIMEGWLLHYGQGRVVAPDDPDLALLLGDQLYALGLVRLAELGDLEGVAALAELISSLAQDHAEHAGRDAQHLWQRAAREVGWGRARDGSRDLDGSLPAPFN